jgi:hypothetical protein
MPLDKFDQLGDGRFIDRIGRVYLVSSAVDLHAESVAASVGNGRGPARPRCRRDGARRLAERPELRFVVAREPRAVDFDRTGQPGHVCKSAVNLEPHSQSPSVHGHR